MECSKPTLSFVHACILLCASYMVEAAQRISLEHLSFSALQRLIPLGLTEPNTHSAVVKPHDFLLLERHKDTDKTEHIRFQQRYLGFPVFGGYAIVHRHRLASSTAAITMNGAIYHKLQRDLRECPPDFVTKAEHVLQHYRKQFPAAQIMEHAIQPIVYVDQDDRAHWAYQMHVYWQPEHAMPSQPTVIVAAHDPTHVLLQWDALTSGWQRVHGLGFGGNRRTGKYQFGIDLPALEFWRDESTGLCLLENDHVVVVDMHHRTRRPNIPISFDCEEDMHDHKYWTGYASDGYDQANGSYSVSNDAMYFGELVKTMYRTQYGVEVLRVGQRPMQMICRVHFSTYFANAFWDGRQMTFGDGDGLLHPLVSLSITAHELSHGFTQQHSGLLYQGQAGGINESFSDMAAQAAEYFVYGKASWQIGADVLKTKGALRFFQHPSRDGVSIERAVDYRLGMDVHHSSGVYNRLYYLLSTHSGWDPKKAFQVMLKANTDYWTPTTTFVDGACGILAASRDLGFAEDDVKDALDEVTIDYGDCM